MEEPKNEQDAAERLEKRPYEAPCIEESTEFETLALTCTSGIYACYPTGGAS